MTKIYFASGLFSEADRMYNAHVVSKLREALDNDVEIYLPQENTDINDKSKYADSTMIAEADFKHLDESDLIVATLDGIEYAQGRCVEIGYAYAKGIPVIGLWTDSRQQGADVQEKLDALQDIGESQFAYINLMLIGAIKLNGTVVNSVDGLVNEVDGYVYFHNKFLKIEEPRVLSIDDLGVIKETVDHPAHYNQGSIETIDLMVEIASGYDNPAESVPISNAVKYLSRAPYKGRKKEDLEKAVWYINRAISEVGECG